MNTIVKNFQSINYVQVILSLSSALIVAASSYFINKRMHYNTKWWEKRIEKYEEGIVKLALLERRYLDLFSMKCNGKKPTNKDLEQIKRLEDDLINFSHISMLYFKKSSNRKLGEVVNLLDPQVLDDRHSNENEINEVLVLLGVCKYHLIDEALSVNE